ncbi:MAG: XRE family transcriptional regulator [Prevotella ruminicola]|uniref:XRE family transcriptional regulator n=1 Tax=Xylanibacter ruminicola TaxID=839 RepID=A0A9D5SCC7_XYLRU|nr:XRE family transcriptional regulator [Xylanibacter ruminicola]
MVNVGQLIKEELESQERTVSWLARKLNCTRATVYRIFDKVSLDTALLAEVSQILHRDFFRELSEDIKTNMDGK